jgi:hypothetical protein
MAPGSRGSRAAIACAAEDDSIGFCVGAQPTIELRSRLVVDKSLWIVGPGAEKLELDVAADRVHPKKRSRCSAK